MKIDFDIFLKDKWLISSYSTTDYKAERSKIRRALIYYKISDKIQVLKPSKKCYFTKGNRFNECAREFILSGPFPKG